MLWSSSADVDDLRADVPRRLILAAIGLLNTSGASALQARSIATEAGLSTMAIYTHFGSLECLLAGVGQYGFDGLTRLLEELPKSEDPVADIAVASSAYRRFARTYPRLYQLIFEVYGPNPDSGCRAAVLLNEDAGSAGPAAYFASSLQRIARSCPAAGGIEAEMAAARFWAMIHGSVTLELAGLWPIDEGPDESSLVSMIADSLGIRGARCGNSTLSAPGTDEIS